MISSNLKEKLEEILLSLGLHKNEILVYLDLVENGTSSALEIARRTRIHRSNTYDSIRKLISKGFVKENIENQKKTFNSVELEKISDYIKQKEQEFNVILPQLQDFSSNKCEKGNISIGEGVFAARTAALELLELNQPIFTYGASRETLESFGEGFLKDFHKERVKRKIMMSHIYNKNAIERVKFLNKLKFTEAKCLPEKYDTLVCTTICGNTVLFLIFSKPLMVMKIINFEVAKAYKNYFNLMWQNAKI